MTVSIAAVGLGNRCMKYLQYVKDHPSEVVLDAIVEPDPVRLKSVAAEFGVPESRAFSNVADFFASDLSSVQAAIVASPDNTHFDIAMGLVSRGVHLLLEKPMGLDERECTELDAAARKNGVIIQVCYVLRYNEFYRKLKQICDEAELGPVISINHITNVGLYRTLHSYVRGPWNRSEAGCSMFLSKCCHDVDLVLWLLGNVKPVAVESHSSGRFFVPENAPEGAAQRCCDCPIEQKCPYSAMNMYLRKKVWISNFRPVEGESVDEAIFREIRCGRYGRCAFFCTNDAVEREHVLIHAKGGVTAGITMDALSNDDNRITIVKFRGGVVYADQKHILMRRHGEEEKLLFDYSSSFASPLHGGADLEMVASFIAAVASGTREFESALDSHLVCFKADESIK